MNIETMIITDKQTLERGIDYSHGHANINHKTGIHYGVISQNECLQAWADSSEPVFFNGCPKCGNELKRPASEYKRCPHCYKTLEESDFYDIESCGFKIEDGEYTATQSNDDSDIFIIASQFYTTCQYCSPCAPGAGYITNTVKNGIKAYCFGHDFFDNGVAPYPVYSVETSEKVNP